MQCNDTNIQNNNTSHRHSVVYNIFSYASCLPLAGRCSGCVVWPALCSATRVLCRPLPRLLLTPPRGARSWLLETDVLPASVKTGLVWAAVSSWGEAVGSSVTTGRTFVAQAAHREYFTFQYDRAKRGPSTVVTSCFLIIKLRLNRIPIGLGCWGCFLFPKKLSACKNCDKSLEEARLPGMMWPGPSMQQFPSCTCTQHTVMAAP